MKKEIEDFYFDLKLPVSAILKKLVERERIPKPSVCAALENIWMMKSTGKIEIKRIHIINTVRKKAKHIDGSLNRDIYTRKYEAERRELKDLRDKKEKFQNIRQNNMYDIIPYWIMIGILSVILYFSGVN